MIPKPPTSRFPLEALIWISGLAVLAILAYQPVSPLANYTACIPSLLGFDFCWGCGLGESIGDVFRGDLAGSWEAHPLGMVTLGVLVGRIITLLRRSHTTT